MSDGHEDGLLIELGHQLGQGIELRISKEADKVLCIAGRNVVALQMEGDVLESERIPVNVESTDGGR